jgi:hypothetical protein
VVTTVIANTPDLTVGDGTMSFTVISGAFTQKRTRMIVMKLRILKVLIPRACTGTRLYPTLDLECHYHALSQDYKERLNVNERTRLRVIVCTLIPVMWVGSRRRVMKELVLDLEMLRLEVDRIQVGPVVVVTEELLRQQGL